MEGINNKARVIVKRAYGLKSADSLWTRLILDLNRASEAVGWSIEQIRQMALGPEGPFRLVSHLKTDQPPSQITNSRSPVTAPGARGTRCCATR